MLALELRPDAWRSARVPVDGAVPAAPFHRHASTAPDAVLGELRAAVLDAVRGCPGRVRAVSLTAAATVAGERLVQAVTLGWGEVDLAPLVAGTGLPLLVGNDATLAGVAEARDGAAAGAGTALHLLVDVGVGGSLTVGGRPLTGATGAGGEFGHLPLGDPALRCPCGAAGCWDLEVDGRALARHLGEPPPADPRAHALGVLRRAAAGDHRGDAAARAVVAALARGTAGLVNAHDPEVVTLDGLAGPLRAAAPDVFAEVFTAGLMAFRRGRPPAVRDAVHGDDGPLRGAAAVGLDAITTEGALADWAESLRG